MADEGGLETGAHDELKGTEEQAVNFAPSPDFLWLCEQLFAKIDHVQFERANNLLTKPVTARYYEVISNFTTLWRTTVGNNIYPALRLILPYRDRRVFNIKDYTLIKAICAFLKLPKDSSTEKKLINWKQDAGRSVRLSKFCVEEIKKRRSEPQIDRNERITIDDLNGYLDQLAIERTEQGRSFKNLANSDIMNKCLTSMTFLEMQYFFDILLKNRPLGGHEHKLLICWHPDAQDYLSVVSDLETVAKRLWDPSQRLGNQDLKINIGLAFAPQLATKLHVSYQKIGEKLGWDFFIEEKMDGERIQMHYTNFGSDIKFYSRRATDYTYLYGNNLKTGTLANFINLNKNVKDCVLDCEVVTFDSNNKIVLPFGMVKSSAKNMLSQDGIDTQGFHPLLMVFDVLYLNGATLVDLPYYKRREYLKQILTPTAHRIEIIKSIRANDEQMIKKSLEKALSVGSEGIILKRYDSRYVIASRSDDWIKIKPEYLEQFGENMDLVLMGRDPSKKDSLMLGLLDYEEVIQDSPIMVNSQSSEENSQRFRGFVSLCIIANGISNEEYKEIDRKTKGLWNDSEKIPPLEYMKFGSKVPRQWIDPKKSLILEIKARSLDNTRSSERKFAAGCTLFGGYCRQIREDKNWKTCYTLQEFERAKSGNNWRKRGSSKPQKVISKKRRYNIISSVNKALEDFAELEHRSDIFDGMYFYVLSDYFDGVKRKRIKKSEIQKVIVANGGQLVQNVITRNYNLNDLRIISSRNTVECNSLIVRGYDIISPKWVFDCLLSGKIMKLEPSHCFNFSKQLMDYAYKRIDQYGDPYERDINKYEWSSLTSEKICTTAKQQPDVQFDNSLMDVPHFLFHGRIVFLLSDNNNIQKESFMVDAYGGKVTNELSSANLVIVVGAVTQRRINDIRKQISSEVIKQDHPPRIPDMVSEGWLYDCIKQNTQVAEDNYRLP